MTQERISFEEGIDEDDGAGGSTSTPTVVYSCNAEVKTLKPSRLLEANQTSLRQGYLFLIWITKAYEPKVGTTLIYRDERLTIQGYRYTDETKRKYEITALEQVTQTHAVINSGQRA